ncbi:hypothetical protein ACFW6Q_04150 [Streptomyces sp. NPDC058737]|uniref:hypothetical protein n=1 Tax=unclassified Streptomyces TaxID=2593676 RepID=UPI0036B78E35
MPVLAPRAGVDQLLFPPDIDVAYHGVLAAVRSGDITEDRLDESVVRILRIKDKVGLLSGPLHLPEGGNALPLRRGQRKPLGTGASPAFPTDDTRTSVPEQAQAFEALGYRTTHLATGREADAVKIDEAVAAARGRARWSSPPTTSAPSAPGAFWCPGCARRGTEALFRIGHGLSYDD